MSLQKKCGTCQIKKDCSEFGVNTTKKDGLQTQCRVCKSIMQKCWYERNKATHTIKVNQRRKERALALRRVVYEYLSQHPCVDCGDADPMMLEFDHVRGEKRNEISQMVSDGLSWTRILLEIAKCEVRCVRCHRWRTAKQFGYSIVTFLSPVKSFPPSSG